jgi:hypothetical protein
VALNVFKASSKIVAVPSRLLRLVKRVIGLSHQFGDGGAIRQVGADPGTHRKPEEGVTVPDRIFSQEFPETLEPREDFGGGIDHIDSCKDSFPESVYICARASTHSVAAKPDARKCQMRWRLESKPGMVSVFCELCFQIQEVASGPFFCGRSFHQADMKILGSFS